MEDNTPLTQFNSEGQKPFAEADMENDNSTDSSPVLSGEENKTNIDQTQSPEGGNANSGADQEDGNDKGFADHPRWKEREDDWKRRYNEQESRHAQELAEINKKIAELNSPNQNKGGDEETQVPSWFGGDEEQWREYSQWSESQLAKAKEDAIRELESQSQAKQKAIEEAQNYLNEQINLLENDKEINPTGEKIDKNRLLKFVYENDMTDSQGRWNYKAGYLALRGLQQGQTKVEDKTSRKQIASASIADKGAETKPSAFMTSEDFSKPGNRPW